MMMTLAAALVLLFGAAAAPATPEAGRAQLESLRAEQAAAEAREAELASAADTARDEVARLQADLVALGDEIAGLERDAAAARTRLAELTEQEQAAAGALAADRAALLRILAALQRAEMQRPPPLAVSPDDAVEAARAAILLAAVTPGLDARASEARARIAEIVALREELAREQAALETAQAALGERRAALDGRFAERAALERRLRADAAGAAQTARRIADQASDLADLIARLENEARLRREAEEAERRRRAAETPPAGPLPGAQPPPISGAMRFAEARGALRPPAEGRIAVRFGAGRGNEGIVIATGSRAQVVSPFDATVEYADVFGNYGRMLILSVGDGYHIILTGLERLYAVEGQSVLAGEPVGEMADRAVPAPELYYEIRRNGAPVDPGLWMRPGAYAG